MSRCLGVLDLRLTGFWIGRGQNKREKLVQSFYVKYKENVGG
jgi:hypothetical protein